MRRVSREAIIVANDTATYAPFADCCVPDVYPGIGIHADLQEAAHELTFTTSSGCAFYRRPRSRTSIPISTPFAT
jgi:hypothetical protein